MTQEEFEDLVNKTCDLAINHSSEVAANFWKNHGNGTIDIPDLSDIVWMEVEFFPNDNNLKVVSKWIPSANALFLYWADKDEYDICDEFTFVICESTNRNQSLVFATYDLDDIKELVLVEGKDANDLFSEDIGDCCYASPWYLLINPRRDVVEWALQNLDYKSQLKVQDGLGLVENRQAIPELKELVLKTLKGE